MGYRFAGFFVNTADSELTAAVRALWPLVFARSVLSPFAGYGFAFRITSDANPMKTPSLYLINVTTRATPFHVFIQIP
jgi:hypothetical protein